jgi:hypothetical protein
MVPACKKDRSVTGKRLVIPIVALASLDMTSASNAQYSGDHPQSKMCSFLGEDGRRMFDWKMRAPPRPSIITMNNDGGWCGQLNRTAMGGRVVGVPMHVVQQPAYGEVSITVLSQGTEILYRPNPDYIGSDSFSVKNEMVNI